MQNSLTKDSGVTSANSLISFVGSQSWVNPIGLDAKQSSDSRNLSSKMGVLNTKDLSFQVQDQDSSSTQSTGQSYTEVANLMGSNTYGKSRLIAQSESQKFIAISVGSDTKSAPSTGVQDFVSAPPHIDYSQSAAQFPFPYAEPFFSGLLPAAYVPQSLSLVRHTQMAGMTSSRVPLPRNFVQDEPIFVNVNQYRAILRRRQQRAKLEAQNKLIKARKPYLHESRHVHALKRARGSGGRFLNTKKLQESRPIPSSEAQNVSGSAQLQLTRNTSASEVHYPDNYEDSGSTTSCSDVTSSSNCDDMFQQPEFRFSINPPEINQNLQDYSGHMGSGGHQYINFAVQ